MDIIIRKATMADIEDMADNRMDFLYQVTGNRQSDDFRKMTVNYLFNNIESNSFLCYIATYGEYIISSAIICIYNVIPKPSNVTGKIGYVFNVYTIQKFRSQGLASKLMKKVTAEAKQMGIGELYLNATDDGRPIYEKIQFQNVNKEMCLKLI